MIKIEDLYATTDLALAAALCLYFPLVGLKYLSPKQATFYFEKTDQVLQTVDQYWSHQLRVDPIDYFFQIKQIKSRLYSATSKEGVVI